MPRPAVPLPKDVIAIAKGLKAEGIASGTIKCADGTEIQWGQGGVDDPNLTELEKWRAKRDAAS